MSGNLGDAIRSLIEGTIVTLEGKRYRKVGGGLQEIREYPPPREDTPRTSVPPPNEYGRPDTSSQTQGSTANYESRRPTGTTARHRPSESSRPPLYEDLARSNPLRSSRDEIDDEALNPSASYRTGVSQARLRQKDEVSTLARETLGGATTSATVPQHKQAPREPRAFETPISTEVSRHKSASANLTRSRTTEKRSQVEELSDDDSEEEPEYYSRHPQGNTRPLQDRSTGTFQKSQTLPSKRDVDRPLAAPRHSSSVLPTNDAFPAIPPEADSPSADFVVLKGASRGFASLPHNDFDHRAMILARNPELLNAKLEEYYNEAVQQILEHRVSTALKCIQSLVVLNLCQNVKIGDLEKVVLAMQQSGTKWQQSYQKMYDNVCASAEDFAQEKAQEKAYNRASIKADARPDPPGKDAKRRRESKVVPADLTRGEGERERQQRHYSSRPDPSRSDPSDPAYLGFDNLTIEGETKGQRRVIKDIFEGMSAAGLDPVRTDRNLIKIEPDQFPEKAMRTLSNKYQVPENGAKFFVAGKVFALLWHESAGEPRPGKSRNKSDEREKSGVKDKIDHNLTIGPYGAKIYSHIRRMVVIRNRKGYCWCIGINSYGGLGLKKPGLKKEERDAHTIIYDNRLSPRALENEPKTFRDPISVEMEPGENLIEASRLHYGKPYVVEWNTRVMNVGTVDVKCMPTLLTEARSELLP